MHHVHDDPRYPAHANVPAARAGAVVGEVGLEGATVKPSA